MAATIFDGISDPMNQRLISGLAKIGLALKSHAWKDAGSQGLTPTQGAILALLRAKGTGEWRLFSISRALAVSAPTASEAVTALVRKGLVSKGRAATDQRALLVQLTPKGRAEAERTAHWPDFLIAAVDELSPVEQEVFCRGLTKMIHALQERREVPISRMCVTCRHFRPSVYDDPDTPHHCAFVNAAFGERHLRFDCPEHDAAPVELRQENWNRFIETHTA